MNDDDMRMHELISQMYEERPLQLVSEAGKYGLFDVGKGDFLIPIEYDELNFRDVSTEYIWVRRGEIFDYHCRADGRLISMPGVKTAYDTAYGMFGSRDNRTVEYFDEEGISRPEQLRKRVIESGGRLVLHNFTYNLLHTIDVYGNILNIS